MNKKEVVDLLLLVADEGVSYAHGEGFEFYHNKLLPALSAADNFGIEKELLAECWYAVGDIHDLNDCPLQAIKAYQKSLDYDPDFAGTYKEMANMQERIGTYALALENLKKAQSLDPKDAEIKEDILAIEEAIQFADEPLFQSSNRSWLISELLANSEFNKVLEITNESTEIKELKCRAAAYGALNDFKNYLLSWTAILELNAEMDIDYWDWFYMPNVVYSGVEIWEILKKLNAKIQSGAFIQSATLEEYYPNLTEEETRELVCDFHILANSNNSEGLKELAKQYPKWEEPSSLAII